MEESDRARALFILRHAFIYLRDSHADQKAILLIQCAIWSVVMDE